ncbi:MAG: DUF308 domain-containing protein [Chloroflexi bacterium]|nr:DUF308 domain-containing protein [Chloroflexota bacterium]
MSQQLKGMMRQGTPWRSGVPWLLVLAEGVVAVAAGIAVLVWPQETAGVMIVVFGGYLIVNGLLRIYAGMRAQSGSDAAKPMHLVRGGIGLVVGLLVVIQPLSEYMSLDVAVTILAIGLLLIGVIGLINAYEERSTRWGTMVSSGLHVVLGILLLFSRDNSSLIQWLGIAALVIGGLLVAYGLMLFRSASRPGEPAREQTVGKSQTS